MKLLLPVVLLLAAATSAFPQNLGGKDFVIDASKPYVYLKFDHIADGDLWLRVVNNSRIAIVLRASGPPEGMPGVSLEDEVVPNAPPAITISITVPGQPDEAPKKPDLTNMPRNIWFEVSGVAHVQPGNDILFSVPVSHVSNDWYMRVRFALYTNESSVVVGPFTYLEFRESDIPKDSGTSRPAP